MPPSPVPAALWFVRHGESAANVARHAALAAGSETVDIAMRDADVPLSALGERQATALGRWWAARPAAERPTVVVASPYRRAWQTARHIVAEGALADGVRGAAAEARLVRDERFREKELGLFHTLMRAGVERHHPEQWALREQLGAFYYRPPNGESGADVVLRVRAGLDALGREYAGERVLVVAHQVTILCARYVLEGLTEEELTAVWRRYDLANCSVTTYRADAGGRLVLAGVNFTVPVADAGAAVTAEPASGEGGVAEPAGLAGADG